MLTFLAGGSWYFFLKPHDYIIRFKAKSSPGALMSNVEEWSLLNEKRKKFSYKVNHKTPFNQINETIKTDSIELTLDWNFKSQNDTISQVLVGVSEKENSFYNRVTAPFLNTYFKETSIDLVKSLKDVVESQLQTTYRVKYDTIDSIPSLDYAYVLVKDVHMRDKAKEMMKHNPILLNYVTQNEIKNGTFPFLIVESWDLQNNLINYRYCFPIKIKDSLPKDDEVKIDKLTSKKALKAVYNGNFITSDKGWFLLHEYAKRNNIHIDAKPVEFFYDNPFMGGNELEWKTEVYMPIE